MRSRRYRIGRRIANKGPPNRNNLAALDHSTDLQPHRVRT